MQRVKMTPAVALNLLRKALAAGTIDVRPHAEQQVEAAGYSRALIFVELNVAAQRGTVGRNASHPARALAYGNILTLSFVRGEDGVVVVTVWVQER